MPPPDEEDADETEIGYAPRPPSSAEPPKALQRPCLVVLRGPSAGRVFALTQPETFAGRAVGNAIRLNDGGVSRLHARFVLADDGVQIENIGSAGTFLNGSAIKQAKLTDGDRIELGDHTALLFTYVEASQDAIESNLASGTTLDLLTGAWTRRRLIAEIERELAYAQRHGDTLTLLVATPSWPGHNHEPESISRAVIGAIAERIRSCIGKGDPFARWSPTAFAIFVRGEADNTVANLALRIAQSVTDTPIVTELGERNVSLHVVPIVALTPETASVDSLIQLADRATQGR